MFNIKMECQSYTIHVKVVFTERVREVLSDPVIDLNIKDKNGMTPLHYACKGGFTECVRLLLSHPKIDPNIQDKNRWSPFYFVYKSVAILLKIKMK